MGRSGKNRKASRPGRSTKGTPMAVLISTLIHVGLFLLAGTFVVFTVVKQKEVDFAPPKAVERPKMKLKKPKVKIKKSSKPKPTTRIVTKTRKANMPDIQLPEMSGMGEGLAGGLDGFDIMPDLGEVSIFGSGQSIGNDFTGIFYDFKRDRNGKPLSGLDYSGASWRSVIYKFLRSGWKPSVFARYYRSPRKLYATNLVVPMVRSSVAPLAFSDKDAVGALWAVHYKGQLVCPASHTNGITFRFWGAADEFMVVRVDGELVFASVWDTDSKYYDARFRLPLIGSLWQSSSADSGKYYMLNTRNVVGDWITLEPGKPLNMEILIGDSSSYAGFILAIEEKGVEYERTRRGYPILPVFKTAELPHDILDVIYRSIPARSMICLTNGPVFCDYDTSARAEAAPREEKPVPSVSTDAEEEEKFRTWTSVDGKTLEAKFLMVFGGKVVLKDTRGKLHKIPKDRLSAEDIEYAELACPPEFNVNFQKNFRHVKFSGGLYDVWERPPEDHGHYGVQLKQVSTGEYNHELQVEMFVIGKQWRRSKYILLDHQKSAFTPSEQENRQFDFRSPREVVIAPDEYFTDVHGEKYYGYLVTVTDARGKTIVVESSHKWLPQKLENLKKLSIGNYMDDDCVRAYPDKAKITWWM